MKKTMIFASLALMSLSVAACSTVEGMGKDLQKASAAVQDAM